MAKNQTRAALRYLLHFQQRGDADDGFGNVLPGQGAYETRFTVAAGMRPLRGSEAVMAARLEGRQPYVITLRNHAAMEAVTPAWRLVDARNTNRIFDLASPLADPDGTRKWLEGIAIEGTPRAGEAVPPPAAPIFTTISPVRSNTGDFDIIEGTALPRAYVTVSLGSTSQTVEADEAGVWQWQPPHLDDGTYSVTATQRIAMGPESASSAPLILIVDTLAPDAPVIVSPASPHVTTDTIPMISGTSEPDATITIYLDGESYGETLADGDGLWSFAFSVLAAGETYEVTATATDAAGNESAPSAPLELVINHPLAIEGTPVTLGVMGEAYAGFTASVPANHGVPPFTFSMLNAAPGLSIDAVTGEVSGTLTQAGIFEGIVVQVEDSE